MLCLLTQFNIYSDNLVNTLSRKSDFKEIDFICIDKEANFVSFDSLLNERILTDYKNNNIPFDLYIYNNGVKEKITNTNPIKLGNSYETCEQNKKKYKIEIKINKENIINVPEDTFFNTLNVSTYNKDVVTTQDIEIIYTTQAIGLQVKQLQDFNLSYTPRSPISISEQKSFCVYTDGVGSYRFKVSDNSGNPNFLLINEDKITETLPYTVKFQTDSYAETILSNNSYIQSIAGNTDINCATGDKGYLTIEISNANLINTFAGSYYPDNPTKILYITVQLEAVAPQ
jgi:hypothetical protein